VGLVSGAIVRVSSALFNHIATEQTSRERAMLYIVYVLIANTHHDAWFRYMRDEHIDDVLNTGCFTDAIFARDADADTETHTGYRILYRAPDKETFERYQREFAPELKRDHAERFAGVVQARRDILEVIER